MAIGFFSQFDSFQTIILPEQIIYFGSGIVWGVVQHADWHQHGQVVREPAAQNEIQTGLLRAEIKIFGAMPGISGRDVNNCLAMPIGSVTNVIMETIALVDIPELNLSDDEA